MKEFNQNELADITAKLVEISVETGNWMKEQTHIHEGNVEIKTTNNLVTVVDKESERRFVEALHKLVPEAGFVAEEGTGERSASGLNWVIDPLDGTTNFVHGVPVWCTSVALCAGTIPLSGVIFDPSSNECYSAYQGGGAFMNQHRIKVSGIDKLEQALLATGFPYDDFGREQQYIALFRELMRSTRGMRRLGSAALDMAWTAIGRFEGFYEYGLNPWDVAAGTIIIREAGGLVTEFNGANNPIFGEDLICTNGRIHHQMIEVVGRFF
ncbi:MAG: inositol monophosphatase [Flavobacteriales bacterium]|nr:inositol monophosphatase [Flavobacteriales bacterium]